MATLPVTNASGSKVSDDNRNMYLRIGFTFLLVRTEVEHSIHF